MRTRIKSSAKRLNFATAWDVVFFFGLVRVACWPWSNQVISQWRIPFTKIWFSTSYKVVFEPVESEKNYWKESIKFNGKYYESKN